ncbi:MAG: glycoside hydrolase family 16 protein [Ruminococcaceae bacterium]|nr:glycoside hydrolase family 16 protein [Oscillospiraceae bacterium]
MKIILKNILLISLSIILAVSLCFCADSDTNSVVSDSNNEIESDNTTSENNSSEDVTGSENSSVIGTTSSENGDTTISTTSPSTPTTSETVNNNGNHTITATYEWHPGLPNEDVFYDLSVRVDNSPVNVSSYTITSKVAGVKVTNHTGRVTLPYSVRAAGKPIVVTVKHESGASCDVSIPCFKWTQTFNDDFNGTELDRTKWKEHWYLTNVAPADASSYQVIDRAKPAKDCYTVSDGKLNMFIKAEPTYDTANKIKYLYSECCLDTAGRFEQTFGLFQARVASAKFSGINTAFWLLPKGSYSKFYTNFLTEDPRYGLAEIDIYESSVAFGSYNRRTFAISEHFYDYTNNYKAGHKRSAYYKLNDDITNFHTYSCIWTADALYYYVNNKFIRSSVGLQTESADGREITPAYMIVDVSLYLDNAWVGKRDFKASDLPIAGYVDWARAYKFN